MKVMYDWLTISSKCDSPETMIEYLGIKGQTWETYPGYYGYLSRLVFGHISIHFGGMNEGVLLEMSGQGCRDFETFGHKNWQFLFDLVLQMPEDYNITRLDIACDDKEGILPLHKMRIDLEDGNWVSRARTWEVRYGTKGTTLNVGSKTSDIFLRIYDKAMERGFEDMHWVRCELQLRNKHALGFISHELPVAQKYYGVLNNHFRFVEGGTVDTNKRRWTTAEYWNTFIECLGRIRLLDCPGVEYNLYNVQKYVVDISGNSIDVLIQCFGVEKVLELISQRESNLSKKQQNVIDMYHAEKRMKEIKYE